MKKACLRELVFLDLNVGDKVIMKKKHPCGGTEFEILRVGMDFKLKCLKCGRVVMTTREKAQKSVKCVLESKNI